jgi:lysophospholipase L1-like esterase
MKILYILLVLLILYSAFTLIKFKYTLSRANLPAIVHEEQSFGQGVPLRYIASGDSTSAGVGASATILTYPYRIAQKLSATNQVTYKNIGVSGAKTVDLINNQLSTITKFNPDIVTISIGANDVTHFKNNEDILQNIQKILSHLTENTTAQIYITDIPIIDRAPLIPFPVRKYFAYQITKLNPKLLALETDRVHVVDIHEFGWNNYPDINVTFAKDKFHPSDEGYNNWTKAFLSKILSK